MNIVRTSEAPQLRTQIQNTLYEGWARFLVENPTARPLLAEILDVFPEYHFGIFTDAYELAALGMTVPLAWDGKPSELLTRGWDWVLSQSLDDFRNHRTPRTLSAVNALVRPEFRGHGLADTVVTEMQRIAQVHGYKRFIAPLRPTLKEKYPLTPIANYARWTRPDGSPFDPWLRIQTRLGAQVVGTSEFSIHIQAPLASWHEWTGLVFPDSGAYILPGGAVPLQVEVSKDVGTYDAPAIWIMHEC